MLLKNTIRKIKKSFGRYLSLLIIIFLGVGFYTGITTAIPDIQDKQSSYYEETKPFKISKQAVKIAFDRVKVNKGTYGIG